jgi:membrane protease YdiL (CAAX protease family)
VTSPSGSPPPDVGRRPWRPVDALKALGWWFMAGTLAYAIVLPGGVTTGELFGIVLPIQSAGAVGAVAWMTRTRSPWKEALAVRIAWGDAIGLLIGAALQIGLALVLVVFVEKVLGGSAPEQEVVDAAAVAAGPLDKTLVAASLIVIGPVAEELVFRGVLLRSLLERFGRTSAVWISATGFAALHLLDPNAWLVAPLLLVLGAVAGSQVISTGRLGRSVAIHAGFNLVTVVALFTAK